MFVLREVYEGRFCDNGDVIVYRYLRELNMRWFFCLLVEVVIFMDF